VRVQITTGAAQPMLLVPDKAIGTDQGRRYVLVVNAQGQVAYRPIGVGAARGSERIVTEGLQAGEQVIVSGLMRVRPGMTVTPEPLHGATQPQQGQAQGSASSGPGRS
jgi:multidrug efflux pump subunit AcrA (membrane-fusion protein)